MRGRGLKNNTRQHTNTAFLPDAFPKANEQKTDISSYLRFRFTTYLSFTLNI